MVECGAVGGAREYCSRSKLSRANVLFLSVSVGQKGGGRGWSTAQGDHTGTPRQRPSCSDLKAMVRGLDLIGGMEIQGGDRSRCGHELAIWLQREDG